MEKFKVVKHIESYSHYNSNVYQLDKEYRGCLFIKEEYDECFNSGVISFGKLKDTEFEVLLDDAFIENSRGIKIGYEFSKDDLLDSYPT